MLLRVRSVPVLAIVFASVFFDTNLSDAEDAIPPLLSVAEKRAWEGGQEFQRGAKLARRFTPQGELRADAESSLTLAQVASGARLSEHELAQEHVIVTGYEVNPVEYPSLPQVEGTRINAGKKSSFVRPDEFPTITNNNFRQALATTPGLLVSEEANSPIINIGYRGLDSQRSENTQVLKDGISIKNEQFGFPESHYVPSLDSIERIEVLRGGASLQYGSQPGGAVNFVTWMPRTDRPFHLSTKNVFGSFDLFTSYTAIDGTVGAIGYYGFYDHRER
ncbi:MAG: TonB-dependent receptor plug domain-containing protein, partial [Chthoniobacterales bacterium]|nr:TonB-dependent receptor plug domain-containing protein [Chthoniobacterales bacterium]